MRVEGLLTAVVLGVSLNASAAPGDRHGHAHRTTGARPMVVTTFAPSYYPSSYSSQRHSPNLGRSTAQPPYYVAMSPKAPPFSFNGSPPEPGWNWQRASFQDIDAEVRARKAARAAEAPAR